MQRRAVTDRLETEVHEDGEVRILFSYGKRALGRLDNKSNWDSFDG